MGLFPPTSSLNMPRCGNLLGCISSRSHFANNKLELKYFHIDEDQLKTIGDLDGFLGQMDKTYLGIENTFFKCTVILMQNNFTRCSK